GGGCEALREVFRRAVLREAQVDRCHREGCPVLEARFSDENLPGAQWPREAADEPSTYRPDNGAPRGDGQALFPDLRDSVGGPIGPHEAVSLGEELGPVRPIQEPRLRDFLESHDIRLLGFERPRDDLQPRAVVPPRMEEVPVEDAHGPRATSGRLRPIP